MNSEEFYGLIKNNGLVTQRAEGLLKRYPKQKYFGYQQSVRPYHKALVRHLNKLNKQGFKENNVRLRLSAVRCSERIAYEVHITLLANYIEEIYKYFNGYSTAVIHNGCSTYREVYKLQLTRIQSNLKSLEEEFKSDRLFKDAFSPYSSFDEIWIDILALKRIFDELPFHTADLDKAKDEELKQKQEEKQDKKEEVRNSYWSSTLTGIVSGIVVLVLTAIFEDKIKDFMKSLGKTKGHSLQPKVNKDSLRKTYDTTKRKNVSVSYDSTKSKVR